MEKGKMNKSQELIEKCKVEEGTNKRSVNDIPNVKKNIKKVRDDLTNLLTLAGELRRSFGNVEEDGFLGPITKIYDSIARQVKESSPVLNDMLRNKAL